jgi:hypothetical protein
MSAPVLFIILTAATARLTRIIVADTILDGPRLRWFKRFAPSPSRGRPAHPLGQLVDCPWCIGWWFAGACVAVAARFGSVPLPLLWWPAVAEAAALVSVRLDG